HAPPVDQPMAVVRRHVVTAPEEVGDRGDLGLVLVDVRREQRARDGLHQVTAGGEELVRAREREARRHGVPVQADAGAGIGQGKGWGGAGDPAYARTALVSNSGRNSRSLSTSPLVIRSPTFEAALKSASIASV